MGAPRARDLSIPFTGQPGPLNAITDVTGVEVGFKTLIKGSGKLEVGKGPVRTGVTAIFPRSKLDNTPVFAGISILNGAGELTGAAWVNESGFLEGPIVLTNSHSVGIAQSATLKWWLDHKMMRASWYLPMISETFDGMLNDINGGHITEAAVHEAMDSAKGGPVAEGNVGGGTGNICFQFKGGTGTASRAIRIDKQTFRIGALVQTNFGMRNELRIAGLPVGRMLGDKTPLPGKAPADDPGSIVVVLATDAPLPPHQLRRLAARAGLGIARTGGTGANGSGDIFVAFSTVKFGGKDITGKYLISKLFRTDG